MKKDLYEFEEKTFPFEIKKLTDEGTFEGYAAIFNKPDSLNEIIEPGAFTKTLKEGKSRPLLWYHDPRQPLGMADLEVDEKGLKVLGALNLEVQAAREKHALMKQKAIRGLSFGFKTILDVWNDTMRILKEVKLYEVSPVTFQAHPAALIANVKSRDDKSFENALKSLEQNIEIIEEVKVGKMISAANMKLLTSAAQALLALLKAAEPSKDTQGGQKGIISESIGRLGQDEKPQSHFSLEGIEILKSKKE